MEFDKELDVRGLNCPMPIMKAKRAAVVLAPGQVLKVLGTDPHSKIEFQTWSRQSGSDVDLASISEDNGVFTYYIRKK